MSLMKSFYQLLDIMSSLTPMKRKIFITALRSKDCFNYSVSSLHFYPSQLITFPNSKYSDGHKLTTKALFIKIFSNITP